MNINELIAILKKLLEQIVIEKLDIQDKSFYTKIIKDIKKENFILKF